MGCCCSKKELVDSAKEKQKILSTEVQFQSAKLVNTGQEIIIINRKIINNRAKLRDQVVQKRKNEEQKLLIKQQTQYLSSQWSTIEGKKQSALSESKKLYSTIKTATSQFKGLEQSQRTIKKQLSQLEIKKSSTEANKNELQSKQGQKRQALNKLNIKLKKSQEQILGIQEKIKAQQALFQFQRNHIIQIQENLFKAFTFQDQKVQVVTVIPQPIVPQNPQNKHFNSQDLIEKPLLANALVQSKQFQDQFLYQLVPPPFKKKFVQIVQENPAHPFEGQPSEVDYQEEVESKEYNPELIQHNHKRFGQVKLESLSYTNSQENTVIVHMSRNVTQKGYRSWLQAMGRLPIKVKQYILFPLNFNFTCKQQGKEGTATFLLQDYQFVLKNELEKRKKNRKYMSQAEIWHILYKIASIGCYCQNINRKIGNVHPNNIVFNLEKGFKIITTLSLPGQLTNYQICQARRREIVNAYLAPEQISFIGIARYIDPPNISVAEVFSLGVTLLSIGTLHDGNEIYQRKAWKSYKFDKLEMDTFMQKFKQIYSDLLSSMVRKMLEIRPQRRIRWRTIIKALQNYEGKIVKHKQFTSDERMRIREKIELMMSTQNKKYLC